MTWTDAARAQPTRRIEYEVPEARDIAGGALALATATLVAQQITGAGATFPNPIYSKWFSEYNKLHPEVEINYQSIGSGGGIRQITSATCSSAPQTAR